MARRSQAGLLVRNEVFTRLLSYSFSGAFFQELFLTRAFVVLLSESSLRFTTGGVH